MKHPSNRELFEYWNTRRGRRSAPDRNEIEPGAIRHLLADTFILAFDASGGHPFRLAGTRVCALFGRNLKGASFLDLWAASSRGAVGTCSRSRPMNRSAPSRARRPRAPTIFRTISNC